MGRKNGDVYEGGWVNNKKEGVVIIRPAGLPPRKVECKADQVVNDLGEYKEGMNGK